jgi:hypothetical protein
MTVQKFDFNYWFDIHTGRKIDMADWPLIAGPMYLGTSALKCLGKWHSLYL